MANRWQGFWQQNRREILRYKLAVVATLVATLLRWAVDPLVGATSQYLFYYFSVVLAASFAGIGPGTLAIALGALAGTVLFELLGHVGVDRTDEITRLVLFLIFGGVTMVPAGWLWRARNQADVRARELARAIEALQESENRYRIVADNTYTWEFWLSPEGRFLYNSPSCQRVTGYTSEAFSADPGLLGRILHPEDRALYEEHRGDPGEACATEEMEFRIIHRNGAVRWISHACQSVYNEERKFLGIRGSNRDISERKQSEAQLHLQAAALEAAANGIAITDAQGTILWANRSFIELAGYSLNELVGQNHRILKSGEQDEAFYRNLWETVLRGEVWRGELVNRRKDGAIYCEEQTITPLLDTHGRVTHFIAIKQDISTRKAVELDLAAARQSAERAKAIAEQANFAKDHFLAVLSHELRTPLTPVVMAVSMLQDQPDLDPNVREMLEMIGRNVEMEARLIDDLLDLTRIVRGKIELQKERTRLCTVIEHAIEVCRPDIEARKLHFGVDWGPRPYWIEAEPGRLQQVFWNLLKNAIKFTPHDGCVGIRCRPDDQGHVIAEVNDSGMGIDPESLERVFDAFEQAERSITRKFGGLGLGLAISRALVELHGGTIEAHSPGRGKGATFRIRLPLTGPAAAPEAPIAVLLQQRAATPLSILLVEDHGVTAKMIKMVLTEEGHEVEMVGDVAAGLELAAHRRFDLLISDLGLPDASGHDLMRQLRARGHRFPGIAMSGYGQEADIQRSHEAGFVTHLTKPASRDQLIQAIALAVGGQRTREQRQQTLPTLPGAEARNDSQHCQ